MASISERLDSVGLYTDALEAVKQLKGLAELKQSITSFNKENEEKVDSLVDVVDDALKSKRQLKKLRDEAKHWTDRLSVAEQTLQELSVPLDYSDQKRLNLFSIAFGLEFKMTEDKAISFIFSNLSPECPSTRCSVTMDIVSVEDNEQWKVLKVEPEAVSGDIVELAEQLNLTKELGQFCKQVRQSFKDYIRRSVTTQ